jgi:CRP/FNR family transcriptional regulator
VYAVRAGFFKTSLMSEDGREQVTSFPMAGDIVGLDGIGDEHGATRAVALAESEVCVISLSSLRQLAREDPPIQHQFSRMLSREIARHQGVMAMLGSMCAEKRLAAFLLNLSRRWLARGSSPSDFQLPMTREDIGSYLGIKLETVSRALLKLHARGLIDAQRRHIEIRDLDGLAKVVGR